MYSYIIKIIHILFEIIIFIVHIQFQLKLSIKFKRHHTPIGMFSIFMSHTHMELSLCILLNDFNKALAK